MPTGCDFICENPSCKAYEHCLTIAGPWPLVEIEALLQLGSIQSNVETVAGLKARQQEGRKYACAIMPNVDKLEFKGTRVQLFCPIDSIIWDEDFEGWDYHQKIPTEERRCYRCKGELETAISAQQHGLLCPLCQQIMKPYPWFTNE